MPLHVFEPRYRDLLRDCLAADKRMLVAALEMSDTTSYDERPALRAVCGLGEVVAHEPLPDGRSNILLRGVARCRIVDELPPEVRYRIVQAEILAEENHDSPQVMPAHAALILLADRLSHLLPSGGPTLRSLLASQREPGPLSDVLSAALVTDPETRQDLLETFDVVRRIERLSAEVAGLVATINSDHRPQN